MLLLKLVDRKAKPRMGRTGIITRHLAFGMQRIDAQADIEIPPGRAGLFENQLRADDLGRVWFSFRLLPELSIRHPRESGDPAYKARTLDSRFRGNDDVVWF
jgi:hypothetical protein